MTRTPTEQELEAIPDRVLLSLAEEAKIFAVRPGSWKGEPVYLELQGSDRADFARNLRRFVAGLGEQVRKYQYRRP